MDVRDVESELRADGRLFDDVKNVGKGACDYSQLDREISEEDQ
jgi:hypothetical protein